MCANAGISRGGGLSDPSADRGSALELHKWATLTVAMPATQAAHALDDLGLGQDDGVTGAAIIVTVTNRFRSTVAPAGRLAGAS